MKKAFWAIALLGALYLNFAYIAHLRRVIHDKQVYIDAGAKGWYQGEDQ